MPFADFKDFKACARKMKKKYGKNANKVCGAIKAKTEGKWKKK